MMYPIPIHGTIVYLHEWFIFMVNDREIYQSHGWYDVFFIYIHTFGVGFFDHTYSGAMTGCHRRAQFFQTKDSPKSEKINLDRFPWPNSPSKAGKLSRSGDLEERLEKSATVESEENKSIW